MMHREYKYFAFISYSHKDERWAAWIQNALESYKLPAIIRKEAGGDLPARIRPVFRDATDVSVGKLRDKLRHELEESEFLIVVCSPNSVCPDQEVKHWVNEEVEVFCKMGREDKIIPVIVEGIPDEAFCPKLKTLELLALDATKQPQARIMNDIIAKILGLCPDELWRREEKRIFRKRVWNVFCAFAAVLLASVGLFYACDVLLEKEEYYKDCVDEWGLPKGIDRLTKEQIQHRYYHYRFRYRGRHNFLGKRILREVIRANSAGIPFDEIIENAADHPVIQKIGYTQNGELDFIDFFNNSGKLLERRSYSGDKKQYIGLKYIKEDGGESGLSGMQLPGFGFSDDDENRKGKSKIKRWHIDRAQEGWIRQIRYMIDNTDIPTCDADGCFGVKYEHDSMGRCTYKGYIDKNGNNASHKNGIHGECYEYDDKGNLVRKSYINAEGALMLSKDGYAIKKTVYKKEGIPVEKSYYDVDGKLCLNKDGYAKRIWKYDDRGYIIETACYGIGGRPCLDENGIAKCKWEYEENLIEETCYGIDGRLCLSKDGFAKRIWEYYNKGHFIATACYGIDGMPCLSKDGFAKRIWKYDEQGNEYDERGYTIATVCYGIDGRPCLSKVGFAILICKYDERGNMIEEVYYGIDGRPCLNKERFAKRTWEYDNHENMTVEAYYGIDGKPCLHKNGFAKCTWKYDERGNMIEEAYYGVDKKPCLHKDGFAKITAQYDANGNVIKAAYYDANGNLLGSEDQAKWQK